MVDPSVGCFALHSALSYGRASQIGADADLRSCTPAHLRSCTSAPMHTGAAADQRRGRQAPVAVTLPGAVWTAFRICHTNLLL
jgi:hypothetical protein